MTAIDVNDKLAAEARELQAKMDALPDDAGEAYALLMLAQQVGLLQAIGEMTKRGAVLMIRGFSEVIWIQIAQLAVLLAILWRVW